MTSRYHGDAPTRSRNRRRRGAQAASGKVIDFQEEAKRRAIAKAVAAGECALCLVRYLMERYPIFFEGPEESKLAHVPTPPPLHR